MSRGAQPDVGTTEPPALTTAMPRINHVTAYQRESQPIWFSSSTADPLAAWRISGIKGTVFEQWYFDSVSDDGKATVGVAFARDASYAILGHGHLRMEFEFVFEDGTRAHFADWMNEATITDTSGENGKVGEVKGVWKGKGRTYTHTIASDGSFAKVELDSPEIKGTFTLTATSPPHFPCGQSWPLARGEAPASTQLCPMVHNVQVIPIAVYEADLVIKGRSLKFKGIGGHEHNWASGSWFSTVRKWQLTRAVMGPYGLTFREFTSLLDGRTYITGFVTEDGKKVFGAMIDREGIGSNVESTRGDGLVLRWEPTYRPGFSGPHFDKSTGFTIHLKTGVPGEEWKFDISYRSLAFDVSFGGGETGLSIFLSKASGGRVKGEVHSGVALVNTSDLPRKFTSLAALWSPSYRQF